MKKIKYILLVIIISNILGYILVIKISKRINKNIINYSKVEAERFASSIINQAVSEIISDLDFKNELIRISRNNYNEIKLIDFNTVNVNKFLEKITENIQNKIFEVEEGNIKNIDIPKTIKNEHFKNKRGGIICEIPAGSFNENSLLANTGPIIPIKLSFIGKVKSSVSTNIKPYGINSAYIEVDLVITITERISLPKLTEDLKIEKNIPVIMKIIQGNIPDYYNFDQQYSLPEDK